MFSKPFLFTLFLVMVAAAGFDVLPLMVFFGYAFYALFSPSKPPFYPITFGLIIASAFAMLSVTEETLFIALIALFHGLLFLALQYVRKDPATYERLHFALSGFIVLGGVALTLKGVPTDFSLFLQGVLFVFLAMLLSELFVSWHRSKKRAFAGGYKQILASASVFALFFVEFLWAVALLPVGFINGAALFGSVYFFVLKTYRYYVRGEMERTILLRNLSALAVLLVVVLVLSPWSV